MANSQHTATTILASNISYAACDRPPVKLTFEEEDSYEAMCEQKSVDQAVHDYVHARRSRRTVLSTTRAVQAVREACLEAEHTDSELVEVIASAAIRAGQNISFDSD